MRTFLTHCLWLILLSLGVSKAGYAQPQAPDCNSCACVPSGFNFDAILADPGSGPIGTANSVSCVAGRTYRRFNVTAGNTYRVSLCGTAVPMNTVLYIRSNNGAFYQLPGACDDDGCGVSNGHASVTFNPVASGTYRAYFYVGSCGAGNAITAPVELTVTYLGPVATPVNDDPCGAIMIPGPLPTSCSGPIAATTLGASATVVSSLGVTPLVPTAACTSPAVQYSGGDVWFSFPVPASGLVGIETSDGANCAGGFGLYTAASCSGTFTMLSGTAPSSGLCSIEGLMAPGGGDAGLVFDALDHGLSPGDMVYVRYWERNNNEVGAFSICVYEAISTDAPTMNNLTQNTLLIVPNPTRGTTELVFTEVQNEIVSIRITDSGGRLVGEIRSTAGVQRVTLPTQGLEQGTYFVRMNTLDGTSLGVTRFVKQ
ncbi:MAG: T9SS type A sorting domain-containing protein [Flavobacteriales bacterium]|nr:T9SS type A sorting domain-containing protein [Flavobacteriales bacterium]